jgi:hypothetical protein
MAEYDEDNGFAVQAQEAVDVWSGSQVLLFLQDCDKLCLLDVKPGAAVSKQQPVVQPPTHNA